MISHDARKQNLGVVIVPNAVAIFLGAFCLITPPVAAIINNGATLAAVAIGTLPLLWTPDRRQRVPFQAKTPPKVAMLRVAASDGEILASDGPVYSAPKTIEIGNSAEQGVFIRFEEKFFLPKQNLSRFKGEILKFLTTSSPIPGTQFTDIESVYLDSPDFQIYQMHFSAVEERFKIRARRYAPNGVPGDGSAHLEYKSKKSGVSRKSRFQVGPKEIGLLWEGNSIPETSRSLGKRNQDLERKKLKERVNWINTLVSQGSLRPSCIVRYRREAFESENLRLTVDDQIAFETTRSFDGMRSVLDSNPELSDAAFRMRSAYQKGEFLLVEVKHPGVVPPRLTSILTDNGCQKAKFSKYCYSVTEAILAQS